MTNKPYTRGLATYKRLLSSAFIGVLITLNGHSMANDKPPLDFSFIQNLPGEYVQLDYYRLHVSCMGKGPVTVLFEPGLGGSSLEWLTIQKVLAKSTHTCIYDRAGYGWSDPSPFAGDVRQLAADANKVINQVTSNKKLILVGHSFGGFVVRMLAEIRPAQIVGIVLVDASHEDQLVRMETPGATKLLPSGNNFVISKTDIPENLPNDIARKIEAFSMMRKSYKATERELRAFRQSIDQVIKDQNTPYSFPIKVLHRGLNPLDAKKDGEKRNRIWADMQNDLAKLSSDGEVIVATKSGHHIHVDEPQLVIDAINSLLAK